MTESKPTHIISDMPEKEAVEFNFDAYAKTITDLIANKNNKTPLVIGVYGAWGSGKTTLMRTVKSRLADNCYGDREVFRKCKTVWFQAWKYSQEEQILAALIEEIFRTMKRDNFFQEAKAEIEKLIKRFNIFKAFGIGIKNLIKVDPAKIFNQLEHKKKLGFYDSFQEFFDRLIWTYSRDIPKSSIIDEADDTKAVLIVFIDDLDRCPYDRILPVLETIKLFMDKKGCVIVLGADNEIIEAALTEKYEKEGARRFMDKIVQVTFRLPQIPEEGFSDFLETIAPEIIENFKPHLPVILPAIRHNPRQLKRFLNNVNLLDSLLHNIDVNVEFNHLLFWNVLELVYPHLARELCENPAVIDLLVQHGSMFLKNHPEGERWDPTSEMLKGVPKSLHTYLQDKRLVDIVAQFRITRDELTRLSTLSRMVVAEEDLALKTSAGEMPLSEDEMAEIPAGEFLYGVNKEKRSIEDVFKIDIYPVTNKQFKRFIETKGYEADQYWSEQGLNWRIQEKISWPKYWQNEKWNQSDHPVVGVSLYEVEAFTNWAGKSLPTEIQWERAARGTDGRAYPWGDEFDKEKCNTEESDIGMTTRVTRYPNGVSPAGCYDMAGNIWEWTSSKYDDDSYVLRGGGLYARRDDVRCINRIWSEPNVRGTNIGFRCVRTK